MKKHISDLHDYICEHTPSLRKDPEYQQAVKEYMELEEEVKEKIGEDLLYKYQCAEGVVSRYWEIAIILQTLRFGHDLMLEMFR